MITFTDNYYGRTMDRMGVLPADNLDTPVNFTQQCDSVGQITKAAESFHVAKVAQNMAEVEMISRVELEEQRARSETECSAAARDVDYVRRKSTEELYRLLSGALACRIAQSCVSQHEQMSCKFNNALDSLQDTLKFNATNTAAIGSGIEEISSASCDLLRRTDQRAASLHEIADAPDAITAADSNTAKVTENEPGVVSLTQADVKRSGALMREAVIAMDAVEAPSPQIHSIINFIDEIAFQANLLVLNTVGKTKHAEDVSHGFTATVSELRLLAQRSANAAKEIKTLKTTLYELICIVGGLVGQTETALARSLDKMGEIIGVSEQFTRSLKEQAGGFHRVYAAVVQIDQITRQIAATVGQSAAVSRSLAKKTQKLTSYAHHLNFKEAINQPKQQSRYKIFQAAFSKKIPTETPRPVTRQLQQEPAAMSTSCIFAVAGNAGSWQEF